METNGRTVDGPVDEAPSQAISPEVTHSKPAGVHGINIDCGKCDACRKAKSERRWYRAKLMAGLLLPFTLASLDLTVIATALPYIAAHFSQ